MAAPITQDKTLTTNKDVNYTFSSSDFPFADGFDWEWPNGWVQDKDQLEAIYITSLPNSSTQGKLILNGTTLTNNMLGRDGYRIEVADIGKLVFDPNSTFEGNATFKFYVDDNGDRDNDESSEKTMTIQVKAPANATPVITGDKAASVNEGASVVLTTTDLSYTDGDSASTAISFTVSGVTNGVIKVDGVAKSTFTYAELNGGKVTYEHNGGETTSAAFNVSVTDGNTTSAASAFSITVNPINDAPVLTGTLTTDVDEGASKVLTATMLGYTDADDLPAAITFEVSNLVHGSVQVGGVAVTSFTAAQLTGGLVSFVHDDTTYNTATFDVLVKDDGGASSAAQKFTLVVNGDNDAPVLIDPIDDQGAGTNTPFSLSIAGAFTDPDGDGLSYTITGAPAWLTFDAATQTFSGTPGLADTGTFTVGVTASDGTLTASDSFDIVVVQAANPTITLTDDTVAENSAAGVEIGTLGGVDGNGVALTLSLGNTDPDNASFAIVGGKLVVASGAALDFETKSTYEITVTGTDGDGATFDQTLTINIEDVREDPKGTKNKDNLSGDAFDNIMNGKKGNDKLTGNDGADTFVLSKGHDKVLDFDPAEDLIDLSNAKGIKSFEDLMANHVTDSDSGFKIVDSNGNSLFLKGIDADDLTTDMFIF